jgi:hypothetical protein
MLLFGILLLIPVEICHRPRIFEKILSDPAAIIKGLWGVDPGIKPVAKNLMTLSL